MRNISGSVFFFKRFIYLRERMYMCMEGGAETERGRKNPPRDSLRHMEPSAGA